jgi:hypothetical protein
VTDYERLQSFFNNREFYDNSFLSLLRCKRKAMYARFGIHGRILENIVGPAANFGTCIHAGIAAYTAGWGRLTDEQRRFMAIRSFSKHYSNYDFTIRKGRKTGMVPTNHTLARGVDILDAYFTHYSIEDPLLRPIEAELGFAVEITPRVGERDFRPFTYIGSIDGIFSRSIDGRLLPRETKTTSSGAEDRLRQLNFDHQPVGYVTCLREFPDCQDVDSFIGDVVLIAAAKLEFARNYFQTNERQRQSWRSQIINKVEYWRSLCEMARDRPINEQLDIFYQETNDCFSYGKCGYYDVCDYGVSQEAIAEYGYGVWNPLLRNPPAKTLVSAEGQVDTITLVR